LIKTIVKNLGNNYTDNYDSYRFGQQGGTYERKSFFNNLIRKNLSKIRFLRVIFQLLPSNVTAHIDSYNLYKDYYKYLYGILNDDQSKELLIKLLAYRIMGYRKVKLPTNNELFWKTIKSIDEIADKSKFVEIDHMKWKFYFYDLNQVGYPIRIYGSAKSIYMNFFLKQYQYDSTKAKIKVEKGDIVIDAGAFAGDNALFFAYQAGCNGFFF
jgi:hypothetical protein